MDYYFVDDELTPYVAASFGFHEKTPDGRDLVKAVKKLPGRHWMPGERAWHITGTGADRHPNDVLEDLGITDIEELDDYWDPIIEPGDTGQWHIYPRFTGYEHIGEVIGRGAIWDSTQRRFVVDATDLVPEDGTRLPGFEDLPEEMIEEAEAMRIPATVYDGDEVGLVDELAESLGEPELIAEAAETFGPLAPFGDEDRRPFDFQVTSAYAIAHGRYSICHGMGSGKSLQSLLAATMIDTQRLLLIVPPVVATNWVREVNMWAGSYFQAMAPDQKPAKGKAGESGPWVRRVATGRKLPDLTGFDAGALIVPDSLIKRDDVRDLVEAYAPDALIVDEAHRFRTWDSQRSAAVRAVARTMTIGRRFALTGTPMLAHPGEMANLLAVTGQLESEFGSYGEFMDRYTRLNPWGKVEPRRTQLSELGERMKALWVMKSKAELLPDLPGKAPPVFRYLDIDKKDYRAAFGEVIDNIIERFGGEDTLAEASENDIQAFAEQSGLGLISPMRRAAGMAKADEAVEYVTQMREEDPDSPVVVFAHHHEVVEHIADSLEDDGFSVDVLDGSTSADVRGQIVDDFQDGQIDVLIASIVAAGVGVTLTRAHRIVFVEQSYTPGENAQAADRCDRQGQKDMVEITYLIAAETIDEQVQNVLATKIEDLDSLGAAAEAGEAISDDTVSFAALIEAIIWSAQKEAQKRVEKAAHAR